MNSDKLIRISIIIQWALIILAMIIAFIEESYLPPLLKEYYPYYHLNDSNEQSRLEFIGIVLWLVAIIAYFIASIGVFKFKIWSRSLYFWSIVLILLTIPFRGGFRIWTPFSYLCDEGATIFIGITIAFLYFSESKEHFNKASNMPMNQMG
jgi:hypothetical protein